MAEHSEEVVLNVIMTNDRYEAPICNSWQTISDFARFYD